MYLINVILVYTIYVLTGKIDNLLVSSSQFSIDALLFLAASILCKINSYIPTSTVLYSVF